jgi:hypothetical protein
MIGFVLGMFVGALLGVLGVAMCLAARSASVRPGVAQDFEWQGVRAQKAVYPPDFDEAVNY